MLHNFPNGLRKLTEEPEGISLDIATTDILRDRERGVPRYCAFRRHLGMRVPKTFARADRQCGMAAGAAEVYGESSRSTSWSACIARRAPPGFGFSDTAFRIFILLASRRLKSDRFFTGDFTPEVYTPAGFAWVRDNSMRAVLERHLPQLRPHFANARNVFFPWDK